jgi:hypothetical protein
MAANSAVPPIARHGPAVLPEAGYRPALWEHHPGTPACRFKATSPPHFSRPGRMHTIGAPSTETVHRSALSVNEEEYVARGVAEIKAAFPDDGPWNPSDVGPRDEWRAAHVVVTGPDSLVEAQPFSGTHSVIDMTHVSDKPDYKAVAPVASTAPR